MNASADRPSNKTLGTFLLIALGLVLVSGLSVCLGSVHFTPADVWRAITDGESLSAVHKTIIMDFRLPQVMTALLAGAALATAGLLMQTVFRNPLADPFVLGVNSGASLGVACVLLLLGPVGLSLTDGLSASGQLLLVLASSGGAALALFVVLMLSRKVDIMSVLIIGLMISYTIGAIVSILMFFSMAERLQAFINWSFGEYGNVSWAQMRYFAPTILAGLFLSAIYIKPLDALLLGERYAESLGTRVQNVRLTTLLAASLLAGTVTGFCGPIGFLGIAAPHLCRYLFQTSAHRILIPASILVGALLSVVADLIARGPGLDSVFPLNAITALIGAPVIIAALMKQRTLKRLF